jgi:hypothetical protein
MLHTSDLPLHTNATSAAVADAVAAAACASAISSSLSFFAALSFFDASDKAALAAPPSRTLIVDVMRMTGVDDVLKQTSQSSNDLMKE